MFYSKWYCIKCCLYCYHAWADVTPPLDVTIQAVTLKQIVVYVRIVMSTYYSPAARNYNFT